MTTSMKDEEAIAVYQEATGVSDEEAEEVYDQFASNVWELINRKAAMKDDAYLNTNDFKLDPGSYSHGSVKDSDLADMFTTIASITGCDRCQNDTRILNQFLRTRNAYYLFGVVKPSLGAEIAERINNLFDHVHESHVPYKFYFGAIEGDGSDFGVYRDDRPF